MYNNSFSQTPVKFLYGELKYMEKASSLFLEFTVKANLQDGLYLAYYDSSFTSLAIKATILDSLYSGTFQEWDKEGNLILDWCFVKGKRSGVNYESIIMNDKILTNVYLFENDMMSEIIQMEW